MKRAAWNNEYVRPLMLEVLIIHVSNVAIYRERTCHLPLSFEFKATHVQSFPKTPRKQIS